MYIPGFFRNILSKYVWLITGVSSLSLSCLPAPVGAYGQISLTSVYSMHLSSWRMADNILTYYSFKIFPRFLLVKTTSTIHHNQVLLTKFEKNLCHIVIEPMTSKVQPAADYWTNDVKMTSEVQLAADYLTVDQETWGQDCFIFAE